MSGGFSNKDVHVTLIIPAQRPNCRLVAKGHGIEALRRSRSRWPGAGCGSDVLDADCHSTPAAARQPRGSTPLLYKLTTKSKAQPRATALQMLSWNPLAVISSRGEWSRAEGADELRRRLDWILSR